MGDNTQRDYVYIYYVKEMYGKLPPFGDQKDWTYHQKEVLGIAATFWAPQVFLGNGPFTEVLAHELGHVLGLEHRFPSQEDPKKDDRVEKSYLMYHAFATLKKDPSAYQYKLEPWECEIARKKAGNLSR
jgi:hypothetical protein